MIPVDQTILHGQARPGNCVAACVATYFDTTIERVPHFVEQGIQLGDSVEPGSVSTGHHWWAMFLGYLAGKDRWIVQLNSLDEAHPGEILFIGGRSPRGVMHQVLYRDGELLHDPHPSHAGVLTIEEILAVREHSGFDHTPSSPPPIKIRRNGTAAYPWQAHCRLCTHQTLHLIDGHGAAAANTRGVGNRTHQLALAAAHAHLLAEHGPVTP